MQVGSLFSGIGGMDKGLTDAGMEIRWHVEIDKWGQRVLSHRFPNGEIYADIRERRDYEWVDLISFGFPCTNLSVAGKRAGLGGDESRLFWAAMAIVRRVKPTWLLVENVPGLLSSNEGRDFGVVLGALAHCGYWWSYRVLDSQYFGVAQRRRRVFIVGHLGSPCPSEILFEPQSVVGHPAPGHEQRQGVASTVTKSLGHHGHSSPRGDGGDNLVVAPRIGTRRRPGNVGNDESAIAQPIEQWQQNGGAMSALVSHPLLAKGNSSFDDSLETYVIETAGTVTGAESHNGNSNPITANYVVYGPTNRPHGRDWHELNQARSVNPSGGPGASSGVVVSPTIRAPDPNAPRSAEGRRRDGGPGERIPIIASTPADSIGVREATGTSRRLDLSMQCRCPDGPRYRGLGNAVTAPVAEWIGRRILSLDHRGRD